MDTTSFDEMNRRFERAMAEFRSAMLGPRASAHESGETPAVETPGMSDIGGTQMIENGDDVRFLMDLPGFETDEIDLTYEDGTMLVTATHESDEETTWRHRSVHERVTLPAGIDEDGIEATYRNGVLEVTLPRSEADAGHRIEIEG